MFGTGTLINTFAIILAGVIGHFVGKKLKPEIQEALGIVNGIAVIFIGISGAMEGMLTINDGVIKSSQAMLVTISLTLGTLIGEIIGIEGAFNNFGEWLKKKSGNAKDKEFVNSFVTASLTVSIGAMAVIGSIKDGIWGDWSILAIKSVLDFTIILVMTGSMGKGCAFSAIPVFILEGLLTVFASLLRPFVTNLAMSYLSLVGSIMIFCVGLNLIRDKKIRVANMLPALIIAMLSAFIKL